MATQKEDKKIRFQDRVLLNADQKYCRMHSTRQYFRPSLSYHLPLRTLFCLFLSGRLRQVLLYCDHWMLFVGRSSSTIASKDILTTGWILTKLELGRNDPFMAIFNNCCISRSHGLKIDFQNEI